MSRERNPTNTVSVEPGPAHTRPDAAHATGETKPANNPIATSTPTHPRAALRKLRDIT